MIRNLSILLLLAAGFARADFSYTMTSKSSMGGNPSVSKYYYKGNKMKTETSNSVMIMDFDAQTVTTINPQDKSYTVKTFAETNKEAATATADVHPDFKDTGEKKVINGFNATQLLLTMDVDAGRGGQKAQMQMEMWISPDVPGVGELRGFYQRNMGKFPWASLGEGANPQMKAVTIEMYKKLAQMNGAAVLEVMHMKLGGAGAPDPSADPRMAAARARLRRWRSKADSRVRSPSSSSRAWVRWAEAAGCRSPSKAAASHRLRLPNPCSRSPATIKSGKG
jgi:hypothetical protein